MKALYVTVYAKIKRHNHTIVIITKHSRIYYPVYNLSSIHIFGEILINKALINLLSNHGISLYFYTRYGKYIGMYQPPISNSGKALLSQANAYLDHNKRMTIAKTFVSSAANNMLKNILYYSDRLQSLNHLKNQLKELIKIIDGCDTLECLRSVEGRIRVEYYKIFDQVLMEDDFFFNKRSYHPPENEVNALLSLLNTLLYNTIASILHTSKMDASIAYLHASNQRSESLNFDIAETFKPIIVDRLVIRLINLQMIQKKHFNGLTLTQEGLKIVLHAFDERINRVITINKQRRSYLHFIRKDVYALQNHLIKNTELRFFEKKDH